MSKSIMLTSTCTCPCGCMSPPITPNDSHGLPSLVTIAGMIVWNGPLVRLEPVEVLVVERKQAAAVLHHEADVARHDLRAEAAKLLWMNEQQLRSLSTTRQINRVAVAPAADRPAPTSAAAWSGSISLPLPGGVFLRDQLGHRQLVEIRVGVVLGPVGEGQLLGLDEQVQIIGAAAAPCLRTS